VPAALLFDLDDTLVPEEPAAVAAFLATARAAAQRRELDAEALAVSARARARELWYAAPTHPYCRRVGISSWEGLWCRFEGEDPSLAALRAWAPAYRRDTWRLALADHGVDDPALAEELGERFGVERRALHGAFPDSEAALAGLHDRYALALVTNGATCLQREKLERSGLAGHFDAVVVSGEVGVGKPDPTVFRHALSLLGATDAVMIGDTVERDVDGALAAGLRAVWINRAGLPRPPGRDDLVEISDLAALAAVL
jgi:putative hydrolase of the HAD superfamily